MTRLDLGDRLCACIIDPEISDLGHCSYNAGFISVARDLLGSNNVIGNGQVTESYREMYTAGIARHCSFNSCFVFPWISVLGRWGFYET